MHDWVAVEVKTDSGRSGFIVTWGRIQDAVDPRPLQELTLRVAIRFSLGESRVRSGLRESRGSRGSTRPLRGTADVGSEADPIWRGIRRVAAGEGEEYGGGTRVLLLGGRVRIGAPTQGEDAPSTPEMPRGTCPPRAHMCLESGKRWLHK